jgi:hypothetical protein
MGFDEMVGNELLQCDLAWSDDGSGAFGQGTHAAEAPCGAAAGGR